MHKRSGTSTDVAPHVLPSTNVVIFPLSLEKHMQAPAKPAQGRGQDSVALTKAAVKKLALPAGKTDIVYWDNTLVGFGLRIRAGGKRTWMVQFRDAGGATRKITVGNALTLEADEARAQAKKLLSGVNLGNDPAKVKKEARAATKLGDLVEQFLAYAGDRQKPSTHEATKRNLEKHAKTLHSTAVKDIDRAAVAKLHEKISVKSGPVQANRVLASLSGFFSWSIGKGYRDSNPVMAVPKNAETARERVLSDDEIRTIWHGTNSGSDHDNILRLLLLTGARRTEIGSMRWEEVDENGLLTVPGTRMKNGLPHEIPLSEMALAQLQFALPALQEETGRTGYGFGKAINGVRRGYSGWSRSKARLDGRLKLPEWGLHDFRRTMSTKLHEADVQPHIVEALLAHVGHKQGVAGTYNRATYRDQKREALALWAEMIAKIVGHEIAI